MTVVLADTSAWIEFDRGTGTRADRRMRDLVPERDVAVTPPVVMEVLAGARSDARERQLKRVLDQMPFVAVESVTDFETAARIYRACRRVGVTPRGLLDCLIAGIALRSEMPLLAHDVDLARIAGVVGLDLDEASLVTD